MIGWTIANIYIATTPKKRKKQTSKQEIQTSKGAMK